MVERCPHCGGATGPGSDAPPCLCALGELMPSLPPPEPAASVPTEKGGGEHHAKALRCPACGGWLESGTRRCEYCKVELASVRCWRCFDLSFAGTSVCARCGASLGLEGDLGTTGYRCPGCGEDELHLIDVGDHRIRECPACSGIHVDNETFERLTHLREAEAGVRMAGGPTKRALDANEPVRYRPCPMCASIMSRKNFGRSSGVIIDVCKEHGVWFDPDELTAVLEFVASGGLRQARERELADARLELSKRRLDAMMEQSRGSRSVYEQKTSVAAHSGGALLSALIGWDW